ncbi:MAG: tRNA lysidine(34) synthetase TilS [Elusimicrobiota bacterium]
MRKKEFAARIWAKLKSSERKNRFFPPGSRVLAAVSGGPDSVCLAHYLWAMSRKNAFSLFFIHFNHGLRGQAAEEDARFVIEFGRSLGVKTLIERLDVARTAQARGGGLEEAGRALRYAALARAAKRLGCGVAATGHHMGDQAESVLLNLLRGKRVAALAGISPKRELTFGIRLVRPLLPLRKSEIIEYARFNGLRFRLDKTNASRLFTRNWIRLSLLPLLEKKNPRIQERLANLAEDIREHFIQRPPGLKMPLGAPVRWDSRYLKP